MTNRAAVQRRLVRQSIAIYRSLVAAGALERLETPDEQGRRVRVTAELQPDFALDSPLSPFVLEAVPHLDRSSPAWPLDVMSVVEATLSNPGPVLVAQLDRVKTEALAALKAAGVEYEERIEALDKLEYPKPLREWTYDLFDDYRLVHPWAADFNIQPKSVARDIYERAMTFSEYVAHYGLTRSEGLVLRYLSDVYKGLIRNVPEDLKTEELADITEWLGELVRQVDSSLIDEWQHLADAAASASLEEAVAEIGIELRADTAAPPPVTANAQGIQGDGAQRRLPPRRARRPTGSRRPRRWRDARGLDESGWSEALEQYFSAHSSIGTGPDARAAAWFDARRATGPLAGTPGPRRPGGLARHRHHRRSGPRGFRRSRLTCVADAGDRPAAEPSGAHSSYSEASAPARATSAFGSPAPGALSCRAGPFSIYPMAGLEPPGLLAQGSFSPELRKRATAATTCTTPATMVR